jgi:hypothetical protein
MNCCCPHSRSASKFFSFFAGRHRKRFEKKGFEPSGMQVLGSDFRPYVHIPELIENWIAEAGFG